MENKYQIGTTVFGNWVIEREIGKGSFGQVFEIGRNDFGEHYSAALKVITVPRDKNEVRSLVDDGMSAAHTEEYFYSIVEDIVKEFAIMSKLKGTTNIVSYEDHQVVHHTEGIGWDILIRMELLSSLSAYLREHPMTYRMVVQLGIDICRGLELCEKNRIVHRDIKPDNIFVSKNGDFKLGDFGVARTMERAVPGSIKGTYNYMAPEVYRGGEYDNRVDLYSLGLVLYKFLNNNRFPFLPLEGNIRYQDTENAFVRRMSGEQIPLPANAPQAVGEVILRACAFQPSERFATAAQMREALENVLPLVAGVPIDTAAASAAVITEGSAEFTSGGTVVLPGGVNGANVPPRPTQQQRPAAPQQRPAPQRPAPQQRPVQQRQAAAPAKKKKKGKALPIILIILLLLFLLPVLLIGAFVLWLMSDTTYDEPLYTDDYADTYYYYEDTVSAYEDTAAETYDVTEQMPEETLPAEAIFADGSRETYVYSEDGKVVSKTVYDANGNFVARYDFSYTNGSVTREKQYNDAGKLVNDTIINEDNSKIVTERGYDSENNMTGGTTVYYDANGTVREVHTLNKFDGITDSVIYDEQGKRVVTRQYHFTAAGYGDGYTEVDAAGKTTRYNEDGTVRKNEEKPVASTTTKAKTTASTTKATTTAQTTAKPAEPTVYTEETRVGSDRVVKYYNVAADGKKTLSNTITYRVINGQELVLTNIDEIRGYGRQNEYDAKGNMLYYLTYNVKYGKRITEIKHNVDGSVVYTKTYEYNDEGKRIRENQYDASDNLTGYITYEYIAKKDGTYKTKVVTYDAKGKILSSIVR